MKTIIGFADGHVAPGQDLRRFDWLGKMIVDIRPDAIWNGGDLATNDSVSFWDIAHADRVTLADDVAVVHEAQARMFAPLKALNAQRKKSKHGKLKIHTFLTLGNHEYRLNRKINLDETGIGSVIDPHDLYGFNKYWKEITEWKDYYEYEGVLFTHCPINGRAAPFSGLYRGRHIALQADQSIVYGHTHKMDFTTVGLIGNENRTKCTLNMPCFMEQDYVEEYARESTTGWSYGCVVITIHDEGEFTFKWYSMKEMEELYG